jgi:hypothetical protein
MTLIDITAPNHDSMNHHRHPELADATRGYKNASFPLSHPPKQKPRQKNQIKSNQTT